MPKSDPKAQKRSGNVRSPGVPDGNPGKFFHAKVAWDQTSQKLLLTFCSK